MHHPTDKPFGFQYEHDGHRYSFDVIAPAQHVAEARVASMARAVCLGEIVAAKPLACESFASAESASPDA